jgi:predicted Zn-dependent protease
LIVFRPQNFWFSLTPFTILNPSTNLPSRVARRAAASSAGLKRVHTMTPDVPAGLKRRSLEWSVSCASGYLRLGMIDDAERELDKLNINFQHRVPAMNLRCHIAMARRDWNEALELADMGLRMHPEAPEFHVHSAVALQRLGRLEEAKQAWLEAPAAMRQSTHFHLSMARLEAQLGDLAMARRYLDAAILLEPELKHAAGRDPELGRLLVEA